MLQLTVATLTKNTNKVVFVLQTCSSYNSSCSAITSVKRFGEAKVKSFAAIIMHFEVIKKEDMNMIIGIWNRTILLKF